MDKKCKNCGQFLDEKDAFCRFCGCPSPIAEEKKTPKLTKRQAEDMLQQSKTIVVSDDMDGALELNYDLIKIARKGELYSLRLRSVFVCIFAFAVSIVSLILAFFIKGLKLNQWLVFSLMFGAIILIFAGLAVAVERLNLISIYGSLKEQVITVPKYGLRKTPMFLLGGYVFSMDTNCVCPICANEQAEKDVKGDLHIELINQRAVAVCNYNRKHIFNISSQSFFDYYLGKTASEVMATQSAMQSGSKESEQTNTQADAPNTHQDGEQTYTLADSCNTMQNNNQSFTQDGEQINNLADSCNTMQNNNQNFTQDGEQTYTLADSCNTMQNNNQNFTQDGEQETI